jgi:hypothetical protein
VISEIVFSFDDDVDMGINTGIGIELRREDCCSASMSPKIKVGSVQYQKACASQTVSVTEGQEKTLNVAAAANAQFELGLSRLSVA